MKSDICPKFNLEEKYFSVKVSLFVNVSIKINIKKLKHYLLVNFQKIRNKEISKIKKNFLYFFFIYKFPKKT